MAVSAIEDTVTTSHVPTLKTEDESALLAPVEPSDCDPICDAGNLVSEGNAWH